MVVVAQGEPKHIERYCGKLAPSVECIARMDTEAYTAYGLQQAGFSEIVSLNTFKNVVKTISSGHTGGQVIGDARMMPGSFIIDRGGVVRWAYYSKDVSDHPPAELILQQAKTLSNGQRSS